MLKRIFDLLLSCLSLIMTLPFYPLIALAIKFDSKGPIFYAQPRIGRNCSVFNIIKFRTMVTDQSFRSYITIKNDSRITSSGKFLRRYKIDEWPTILNVIKSEMSFVGPRPEAPKYVALYTEEQKKVLAVKPGITDPATITYNNEVDLMYRTDNSEDIYIKQLEIICRVSQSLGKDECEVFEETLLNQDVKDKIQQWIKEKS